MHNLIANIAKKLGCKTWYYITYQFPIVGGYSTASDCISISPWLRKGETMNQLLKFLHEQSLNNGSTSSNPPNIINITKIGS